MLATGRINTKNGMDDEVNFDLNEATIWQALVLAK